MRPFAFIYFLLVSSLWAAEAPQPLLAPGEGLAAWKEKRVGLIARWEQALGAPTKSSRLEVNQVEVLEVFMTPEFKGTVLRQCTGPDSWQRILLMEPLKLKGRAAGVVVPFYDPDRMCGYDLKTKAKLGPERNTAFFGLHLVQQGYVVAAVEAYPFNLLTPVEQVASKGGMGVWRDAAAKLAKQHPQWTGMGKLTHDTRLAAEVFQIGMGSKGRWLESSLTDATLAISMRLARSKLAAASMLYVAVADLIPGLHRRTELAATAQQVLLIGLGIATIWLIGTWAHSH